MAKKVVALAGVGSLGKYIYEELTAKACFDVVVLSRKSNQWLDDRKARVYMSDYSEASVLSILDLTNASTLISLMNCPFDRYVEIHRALLNACQKSKDCKRFIPSEWAGNIDDHPLLTAEYASSREPFRKILTESSGVEWTLFNFGWLADYFLPQTKTYMPAEPDVFPIDLKSWRACIRGTGNELQSWTCAREVAKAVAELLEAPEWEPATYVSGEWSTFNKAVEVMETYHGRPLEKSYKSVEEIERAVVAHADSKDAPELFTAHLELWMVAEASACPREKTLAQRSKYFGKLQFSGQEELLRLAERVDFV